MSEHTPVSLKLLLASDVLAQGMPVKKKLKPEQTPAEQFQCLRQVGLNGQQCRDVLALLREDDKGHRTCAAGHLRYPQAFKLLQTVSLPGTDGEDQLLHFNDFPQLIQQKVDACPLFAILCRRAVERYPEGLTLLFFCDESTPGNVLAARAPRKSNCVYVTFLELDVLFKENLWITFSTCLASEAAKVDGGYCTIVRRLLEAIRRETEFGFPLQFGNQFSQVFLKKVLILADHEGLRSLSGSKGASGVKPCHKCINVLSQGREAPGHTSITEIDASQFMLQTAEGVSNIQAHLENCRTKAALQSAERDLGWNLDGLQKSFLNSPMLQQWATFESLCFDSMHQYWSCGMISQELGLWFTQFLATGNSLQALKDWAQIGWRRSDASSAVALLFCEKLCRKGCDYRGDAAACAAALPLCWAFGQEMLTSCDAMATAMASLTALYEVCLCIQQAKIIWTEAQRLPRLQEIHMAHFHATYGADCCRPKSHYARHLCEQIFFWRRHVDSFVGERKHRLFKALAPDIKKLNTFSRTTLLTLTEKDLTTGCAEECLWGRLVGKPQTDPLRAEQLGLPATTMFGAGIEIGCVEFHRGDFVVLTANLCVEICAGAKIDEQLYCVVFSWQPARQTVSPLQMWQQADAHQKPFLLPAHATKGCERARLVRRGSKYLTVLR